MEVRELKALPKDLALLVVSFVDPRSETCKIMKTFLYQCQSLDNIINQFYHNENNWFMHRDVADLLLFEVNMFKTLMQRYNSLKKTCFLSRYYLARYFARGGLAPNTYGSSRYDQALRRYCALCDNAHLYLPMYSV
jgi:hypothetical protein